MSGPIGSRSTTSPTKPCSCCHATGTSPTALGKVEEVRGAGVVGEQPELNPGDSYQYTSGCPLSTPSGIMVGHYTMRNRRGETFEIAIPAFSLDMPDRTRTVN